MAQQFDGTTRPLVEVDGVGGHSPVVKGEPANRDAVQEIVEVLKDIRLETRAMRLAFQEWVNEGNFPHNDYLDLARTSEDRPDYEESL